MLILEMTKLERSEHDIPKTLKSMFRCNFQHPGFSSMVSSKITKWERSEHHGTLYRHFFVNLNPYFRKMRTEQPHTSKAARGPAAPEKTMCDAEKKKREAALRKEEAQRQRDEDLVEREERRNRLREEQRQQREQERQQREDDWQKALSEVSFGNKVEPASISENCNINWDFERVVEAY